MTWSTARGVEVVGVRHLTVRDAATGEPLRRGVASLEAHAEYLAALPDHPAPADFIPMFTGINGKAMFPGAEDAG